MSKLNSESWFLVESQLVVRGRHGPARLLVQCQSSSGETEEISLPILQSGRLHELVRLPDDVTSLVWKFPVAENEQQPPVKIRKVGWFERIWRMTNRVIGIFTKLTHGQRVQIGFSLWKALSDLPGAYAIAKRFREYPSYSDWIERHDRLDDKDMQLIHQHIQNFSSQPHFHLLLIFDQSEQGAVQVTLNSLKQQLYQNFTCTILDTGGTDSGHDIDVKGMGIDSCVVTQPQIPLWLNQLNESIAEQRKWVMLLQPGDVLAPHALYWFTSESFARPQAAILYSDDDMLDADRQRCNQRFKPDWSLTHCRATHFMGNSAMFRGSEVAAAGGINLDCCRHGNYDLLLRVIDLAGDEGIHSVAHIPAVLLHQMHKVFPQEEVKSSQWYLKSLNAHLTRNRVMAELSETLPRCWRVHHQLPDMPPLVSIIVPTRDEVAMIRQCMGSLLAKTTYPRFEVLVVDNQSADPEALAYLKQIDGKNGIKVLRYGQPFNFSAINNFAVRKARGEVLCLLNNDTEVISPDWLEEMVGHLRQPKVGVVGAKLYYPDGRVQHAGDTVGPGGCANHLHSFIERNDPGYCNRAIVAQELSAVTGACMVTWKSIYEELHGLDEKHLPVAFNDVDYCLRVREAGCRVVWTPHAELYHHESVSRGKDRSPEKIQRAKREVKYMRKRWKHVMRCDSFYNPNLSYERSDFSLSNAPLVVKPWLR